MDEGDDAFDDFAVELLEVEELAGHVSTSAPLALPRPRWRIDATN
jgi:hypothetical protein